MPDRMGELILNAGGFPVGWYPAREDGRTKGDDHPLGEGCVQPTEVARDGKRIIFQPFRRIRMPESRSDKFWKYTEEGLRVPVKRIIPAASQQHLSSLGVAPTLAHCPNVLEEKFLAIAGVEEPTDYAALKAWVKALDDFLNTLYTIAAAGDYAGYNAAIGGGTVSSGDSLQELDGGSYDENIADNGLNAVQLVTAGSRPRIHKNVGVLLDINANTDWLVDNMEFDGTDGATHGIFVRVDSVNAILNRIIFHDLSTAGILVQGRWTVVSNCIGYLCPTVAFGVGTSVREARTIHCTAAKSGIGFSSNIPGAGKATANIGSGNTTDYANHGPGAWDVSGDGTEPGYGGQPDWLTSYFKDYDANNFEVNANGQAYLAARFKGWPASPADYLGNLRKKSISAPVFYPGAHDPDPVVRAGAAQVPFAQPFKA